MVNALNRKTYTPYDLVFNIQWRKRHKSSWLSKESIVTIPPGEAFLISDATSIQTRPCLVSLFRNGKPIAERIWSHLLGGDPNSPYPFLTQEFLTNGETLKVVAESSGSEPNYLQLNFGGYLFRKKRKKRQRP
jgi:hypothetical protein